MTDDIVPGPLSMYLKALIKKHGEKAIFEELMFEIGINPVWAKRKLEIYQ